MQIGIFLRVNVGLINHTINASAYIDVFLFPMYLYGSMPGLVSPVLGEIELLTCMHKYTVNEALY